MVLVTLLSLFSFQGVGMRIINIPHLDKIVHFGFYFIAAILGCMALCEINSQKNLKHKQFIWILVFTVMFGIIIEILQAVATTYRSGDVLDFIANSLGAICGLLAVYFFQKGKKNFN